MGFLDDVQAEQVIARPQSRCGVAAWLETVDADVAAEFEQVIANEEYAATVIHKVMRQRGFAASLTSVRRHRRNECQCR